MKCRSVGCVWSESPPVHKVTATVVLDRPPTLYTGGSDGSIFWWNLSSSLDHDIKPVAILCGHTAPISDMGICSPSSTVGDDNETDSSNVAPQSSSVNYGSLISACTDGVLCVWGRDTGHCTRRRKMPAWVGSPYMVQPLPGNNRYVCVACRFIDPVNLIDHQSLDSTEHHEPQSNKPSKCTVVIIDSYTLTIVQTVFRGTLSIGPFEFMSIVTPFSDMDKESVLIADSFGNVQCVPLLKDTDRNEDITDDSQKNSRHLEMSDWVQESSEGEHPISFAASGQVLAVLYTTNCVFKLVDRNAKVGEISLLEDVNLSRHDVAGCLFLGREENINIFVETFAVWNNKGYVIMYTISYSGQIFKYAPLCAVPAVSHPPNVELSFSFILMNQNLVRVESICLHTGEPVHWKPLITIWEICDNDEKFYQECRLVAKGSYFDEWFVDQENIAQTSNGNDSKERVVTSSMVISENDSSPYAIVYGYDSGQIEVLRFNMFSENADTQEVDSCASKQYLSGHTGAILCLAAHQMVSNSRGFNSNIFLISGSMDCTIRIWDLNSSNLVTVMHQHVQPVRRIILPPSHTDSPWSDCFLSVGDDACVALASLETLRVERMFPGHPYVPSKIVWDSTRGYLACFSLNHTATSDSSDVLYIWDVKSGARERVLRGSAAHSMFDHFCMSGNKNNTSAGSMERNNTSTSSLVMPVIEDTQVSQSHTNTPEKGASSSDFSREHPITCSCPFPGIATLTFDMTSLMSLRTKSFERQNDAIGRTLVEESESVQNIQYPVSTDSGNASQETLTDTTDYTDWAHSLEGSLFRFSLSVLHLWDVDYELDKLLVSEMKLKKPKNFFVASGLLGDRGSLTLTFPGQSATLELWRSSSEFSAIRSLTMVSLAQHMISLSHSCSSATSALAAFYTRQFAEKFPDIKPPLLQLLISFWQDKSEHVRMAARSLFHCAASRAIPHPLRNNKSDDANKSNGGAENISENISLDSSKDNSEMLAWLESFERQDWISCVWGTSQDAMTSHMVVAAALAVWYPTLVKPGLAMLCVHPLLKLVMAMNEKYSSTAAEILAEGMESTWSLCIGSEIPRIISDIFLQIEHVNGASAKPTTHGSDTFLEIQESLVGILLPSLAMADVPAFLHVIERQIWSTASDSPVHIVALMTLIRVARGSPRNLAPYLDKVVNFILQTMDPGNLAMRRSCLQKSMATLKEVVRVFPMVTLNDSSTRLAVGDAVGDINKAIIRIYDMQSMTKIKILDASGPPGLPTLLGGASDSTPKTAISALSFSPDGEGLVAFSEHGLMIRWWSLGSMWWEKLSRNLVPVQCTKLIFVPPWEGFSPTSTRSSIMASVMGNGKHFSQDNTRDLSELDRLKLLLHNLDLSYRLEWVSGRNVLLKRHGQELGTFQL
ncbi:transducin/WD40 repeat-like superfamily protein [Artemisia annua]|uniref:Transducin/WD40 repeat-like superfamily protein n=1 Tax=Artemisia annua TaxID=35608 RepID=A0A2U1NKT5_ARTAN|nr:transducin/WD40 repeat-like superfamily protein [Artemisia annua]